MVLQKAYSFIFIVSLLVARLSEAEPPTPSAGVGTIPSSTKVVVKSNLTERIGRASAAYRELLSSPAGKLPPEVLESSRCVAVFPDVTRAAFVVGGSHGDGVAACRLPDGVWSYAAFMDLVSASIGMQAGLERADWVLFFTTPAAEESLKKGKVRFDTDVTVMAGRFEKGFEKEPLPGVVAYSSEKGRFVGLSVSGLVAHGDREAQESYYGKEVSYESLLGAAVGQGASPAMLDFLALLPKGRS